MAKRFDVKTCMSQEKEGKYVLYSEYAALEAELAQQTNNSALVSALQFLRDSIPSAMESYPQTLSLISQLEERLNNIVTSQ